MKQEKEKRTLTRTIFTRVACNFSREKFEFLIESTAYRTYRRVSTNGNNFVISLKNRRKRERPRHRKSIRVQNDRIWVMETRPKGFSDTTQPPVAIPLLPPHHGWKLRYFFRFTRIENRNLLHVSFLSNFNRLSLFPLRHDPTSCIFLLAKLKYL